MKSHRVILSFAVAIVFLAHSATNAPIPTPSPKPIEDIFPQQLPDPGIYQAASTESNSISPALLATGFNLNDSSELSGRR